MPQADGHICHLVVMPGVPREMKPMTEESVIPWLRTNRGSDTIYAVRVFQTFGISESGLDEAVAGLIKPEEARVAFRAAFPQISLRVTVEGKPGAAERKLDELSERVRAKVADFIYAEGDASMEQVVAQLLTKRNFKLAVAESCTGGLIGHRLTNVAGSSKFFIGDFVTYSNDLKTGVLGVREETLKQHGAVSEQCVLEMAAGARERARRRCRDCHFGRRRTRRRHPRASGGHGLYRAGRRRRHPGRAPLSVTRQPRLDKDSHRAGRAGLVAPLRAGTADRRIDAVPPLTFGSRSR